jgi:hypothetical protein
MSMRIPAALVAATLVGSFLSHAQEKKESSDRAVYRVEFDVRDSSEGEAQPAQHFSMLVDESRKGIFQAMSRIPAYTGSSKYIDVGANIECTVHESDGKTALRASIELTNITGYVNFSSISEPIVGQRKAVFDATVELGTRTLVVDDRDASHQLTDSQGTGAVAPAASASTRRVEATVTKLN